MRFSLSTLTSEDSLDCDAGADSSPSAIGENTTPDKRSAQGDHKCYIELNAECLAAYVITHKISASSFLKSRK